MNQDIDDILRELSGLSFDSDNEEVPEKVMPESTTGKYSGKFDSGHTPSVTETLKAVQRLIDQSEENTDLTPNSDENNQYGRKMNPQKADPGKEEKKALSKKDISTSKNVLGEETEKNQVLNLTENEKKSDFLPPRKKEHGTNRLKKDEKSSKSSKRRLMLSRAERFTPVVRVEQDELRNEMPSSSGEHEQSKIRQTSKWERAAVTSIPESKNDTQKFIPSAATLREEKLAGGAALRSVTRKASSSEANLETETKRINASALNEKESDFKEDEKGNSDTRVIGKENNPELLEEKNDNLPDEDAVQAILDKIEHGDDETELSPELSRSDLRRLKKEQEKGNERLRKEKRKEREKREKTIKERESEQEKNNDSEENNLYRVKESASNESQLGFAPCFKKLSRLNFSDQISLWRKALRDMTGSSIGLSLLLGVISFISLVLICMSEYLTDSVGEKAFILSIVVIGLIGGLIGWSVVWGGICSLFHMREDRDTLPSIGYLAAMAGTIGRMVCSFIPDMEFSSIPIYLPVGLLGLSLSYLSRWMTASTALRNLRFLHSGGNKYYLHVIRDSRLATEMTRGVVDGPAFVSINRQTESIADFMRLSFSIDDSDRYSRALTLIGIPTGFLAAGFTLLIGWNLSDALTILLNVVCLFASMLTVCIFSYPSRKISRFMERAGGMVISEKAITRYSLLNGAVMDAKDIFPAGFTKLSGFKTYGSAQVDDVILDAASMIKDSGSILESVFESIVRPDDPMMRTVEERSFEDGMGLSGFIGNRQILLGTRNFLESRGIRLSLDENKSWNSGIGCTSLYLASGGELTGVFLIRLQSSLRSEEAVQTFADNGIRLSIRTTDGFLTPRLIGRLFKVNPEHIKILPGRLNLYVDRLQGRVRVKQPVAVNDGSISGYAGCAVCARRLAFMEGINRVLVILSVVIGLAMLTVFSVLGALSSITPLMMTFYSVFWPVLGYILQKLIRI